MMKALVLLLAVAGLTSAFPNYWRDSSYRNEIRLQQNTGPQCAVTRPAAIVCQSARLITSGRHTHVHICPANGNLLKLILIIDWGYAKSACKINYPAVLFSAKQNIARHCIHVDYHLASYSGVQGKPSLRIYFVKNCYFMIKVIRVCRDGRCHFSDRHQAPRYS